jgi:hypothetical protein
VSHVDVLDAPNYADALSTDIAAGNANATNLN